MRRVRKMRTVNIAKTAMGRVEWIVWYEQWTSLYGGRNDPGSPDNARPKRKRGIVACVKFAQTF